MINKDRSIIKVFQPFEIVSKPSPSIDIMMISYGCVYKRSSKPVMKGSRVETVEVARKEYAELLKEGWKKTFIFKSNFFKFGSFNEICLYECRVIFIMQISFFAKVVLFLALYCISDLSIKNNILRKVVNKANRAKKV